MDTGNVNSGRELIADIDACEVGAGQCALWWLGQHSFVARLGQTVCYLDPYLTPSASRRVEPLLAPGEVTNAALVLGTHDHGDHIDRPAWPGIAQASPRAKFIVPELLRERVIAEVGLPPERVVGLDDGRSAEIDGVKVTGVPAAHELLDVDADTGLHPYLGFVLEGNGFTLYHAGDTCLYEGIHDRLRQWKLGAALMPINGRDAKRLASGCIGNMTYQETADLAGAVEPGLTIPTHFEMFAMNSEDPQLFVDYMRVKYPHLQVEIPQHGRRMLISRA
jgi:L-ascorbate metabolism protein UlaG (beta-lactamase superfamily)